MLALVAMFTVTAVGCGSDDDSSGGSGDATTSEDVSAGVAEAKSFVAEHSTNPTEVPNGDKPVSKRPPEGKHIVYLECGVPNCKVIGDGIQAGAEALGWRLQRVNMGLTPEEVNRAWEQVVQIKPDGVLSAAFGREYAEKPIAEVADLGIPWVATSILDKPGVPPLLTVAGQVEEYERRGQWMARWLAADTDGKADAVLFNAPAFVVLKPYVEALQSELGTICPECKLDVVDVNPADAGTKLPAEMVNYLQRNPNVNYAVPGWGDAAIGVPQALAAAGLKDKVKLASQAGSKVNYEQVDKGELQAMLPEPSPMLSWMMLDPLVREFVGDEVDSASYAIMPSQYMTPDNVLEALGGNLDSEYPGVLDYQEQYRATWKLDG